MSFVDEWIRDETIYRYHYDFQDICRTFEQNEKNFLDAIQELKKLIESSQGLFETTEAFESKIKEILRDASTIHANGNTYTNPLWKSIEDAARMVDTCKLTLEFTFDPNVSSEERMRTILIQLRNIYTSVCEQEQSFESYLK